MSNDIKFIFGLVDHCDHLGFGIGWTGWKHNPENLDDPNYCGQWIAFREGDGKKVEYNICVDITTIPPSFKPDLLNKVQYLEMQKVHGLSDFIKALTEKYGEEHA
jgi:hypothetical protein